MPADRMPADIGPAATPRHERAGVISHEQRHPAPGEGRSAWVVGDLYTVKAGGEDTGGAFALIEVLVPSAVGPAAPSTSP